MTRDPGVRSARSSTTGFLTCLAALLLLVSGPAGASTVKAPAPAQILTCPSCDDYDSCTVDSCDATTGTCRHDPLDCNDHNPCTADQCTHGVFGGCYHPLLSSGTACDDGAPCTVGDACDGSGVCTGRPEPAGAPCSDGNGCTSADTCDTSGQCLGTPLEVGSPCDDQNLCTSGDTCVSTSLSGLVCMGSAKTCDDGDTCTVDSCDPASGVCRSAPVICDDGNSCTVDSCDPATGACLRENVTGSCEEGNFCTVGDVCSGGNCLPGSPRNCEDGNPCTIGQCRSDLGVCLQIPNSRGGCDDHNACTLFDECFGTSCFGGTLKNCNDNNDCTFDDCVASTGECRHFPRTGGPCFDGNACTGGDICNSAGVCISGAPLNCDDHNACTIDSCDPARGCLHAGTPENICDGIDNDCDGLVDEGRIQAACSINPSTLNLNAQGSTFSIGCSLMDLCDPAHPVPVSPSTVERTYISRADDAANPGDDVTLPDPSTLACPDPTRGTLFERGIAENLADRGITGSGVVFRFNLPADGDCATLDGDRQELQSRLSGVPDGTEAMVCIAGKAAGISFEGCLRATVKNHGLR